MSTRSLIGIVNTDGTVHEIYCHSDSYIENGVGEKLFLHYHNIDKINELINGGDISVLGSCIDTPEGHTFNTPANDCTVFYNRDRGETFVSFRVHDTVKRYISFFDKEDLSYCYLYQNEKWLVRKRGGEFKQVSEYLTE